MRNPFLPVRGMDVCCCNAKTNLNTKPLLADVGKGFFVIFVNRIKGKMKNNKKAIKLFDGFSNGFKTKNITIQDLKQYGKYCAKCLKTFNVERSI